MVFDYTYVGPQGEFLPITTIFPPAWVGMTIAGAAALFVVVFWSHLRAKRFQSLDRDILVASTAALLGIYLFSVRWVDEVYVNLEHPFNLFHHGMFSFSPLQMVDGTVEFVYYLLLTPFAFNQISLIYGGLLLAFVVCWLHLFTLWKLLGKGHPTIKLLLLLFFALATSFVYIFSSGFGNGLVSLVFFLCIYYQLKDRSYLSLTLASLMPLLRPDAILYSFSVFFVETLRSRKIPLKHLLATIGSTLIYLTLVRSFYGHWVPTPVSFKSFKLSMIPMIDWTDVGNKLLAWPSNFYHIAFLITLVASFWLLKQNSQIRKLKLYTLPLTLIFLFYVVTTSALVRYEVQESRYYVGFELFVVLFPIVFVWQWLSQNETNVGAGDQRIDGLDRILTRPSLSAIVSIIVVALYLHLVYSAYLPMKYLAPVARRTNFLSYAGQVVDQVVPKDWSVSATEMNAFGFMMPDREVIDLWGYSNPAIAHSDVCSQEKVRSNPDLFLQLKPDVFWWWYIRRMGDDFELLLQSVNLSKRFNQLGDMMQVMQQYDLFLLQHYFYRVALLIRKDRQTEFLKALEQANYGFLESRELDLARFQRLYDSQRLVQFPCG